MSKPKPTPRQRAEHVLATLTDPTPAAVAEAVLAVALDPEEMAREAYRQGAWCGDCDFDGWASCPMCRQVCREYAVAIRDDVLRGPA